MSFLSRILHLNTEAVVTIAATVTFAGFVYYSFVYVVSLEYSNTHRNVNAPHTHRYRGGNDNENRDGFEYVAGDPYWNRRDDLFVRGEDKLRKSLKRQTETGGPRRWPSQRACRPRPDRGSSHREGDRDVVADGCEMN